jgi:hypothetical protein
VRATFLYGSEKQVKENESVGRSQAAEIKFFGIKLQFRMTIKRRENIYSIREYTVKKVSEATLGGRGSNRL